MRKYAKKFAKSLRKRNDFDYQLAESVDAEQSEIKSYVGPSYISEIPIQVSKNEVTAKELMHYKEHDVALPAFNRNFNTEKNEVDA